MRSIIAFQGSPRSNGNTAKLIEKTLSGARDAGAETDLIQISSLKMTGCKGCYSCKKKASLGKCVLQDDMTPLYQKIEKADAVIFGSPVYMCAMTPELKMVIDRLFPYLTFDLGSLLKKNKKTALIFTQNQENAALFESHINMTAFMINTIGFAKPDILLSVNTIGYNERDLNDFTGNGSATMHEKKLKYKAESWDRDLDAAYALGRKIAI